MNVLMILCHPDPGSLNHAAAQRLNSALIDAGHLVELHDLYAERFDPVLTAQEMRRGDSLDELVQAHCRALAASDLLVIIHPDWWGQPPALLKGWIDRVLRNGIAYEYEGPEFGEKRRVELLGGVTALVACTTDALESKMGHPIVNLWRESVFAFCGITRREVSAMHDVRNATRAQRESWLCGVAEKLLQLCTSRELGRL